MLHLIARQPPRPLSAPRAPLLPRHPRLVVPGVPLHITQRGVDRRPTFLADDDRLLYLHALRRTATAARCAVHAYVLMTNHVHLLVTPADLDGPARMMRALGTQYVRYFNYRYGRTGTLWEGRYRSALVTSGAYFFACSRYIELNPVRAGLVNVPVQHRWSSVHANVGDVDDPLVTPHALYLALGAEPAARRTAYGASLADGLPAEAIAGVRTAPAVRLPPRASTYQQLLDAGLPGDGRDPFAAHAHDPRAGFAGAGPT